MLFQPMVPLSGRRCRRLSTASVSRLKRPTISAAGSALKALKWKPPPESGRYVMLADANGRPMSPPLPLGAQPGSGD